MVDPESSFSVSDVRALVGGRRVIDVMDCKTQRPCEMTMREFEQYFDGKDRTYLYNAVSLEFSKSKLETMVDRPTILDYIDWVDLVWPQHLKQEHNIQKGPDYPKVQRYCLMSVVGCFSDFHIDFGGTSVWYYQFKGERNLWLIPPTEENLRLYEEWIMSGCQAEIFFGDLVSNCQRICLEQGNSIFIPGGYIYAVYTTKDSIVFSGNFLNSFNIPMQLQVFEMEKRTSTPIQFQFPFFTEIHWYALERYVHTLTGQSFLCEELKKKALPNYQKDNGGKESENSKDHVHITQFEYKGLQKLVDVFKELPKSNRGTPEYIVDPDGLLQAGRLLLDNHTSDNPALAITGKPKAFWPQLLRPNGATKKVKLKPKPKKPLLQVQKKLSSSSSRVRRIRCKVCAACTSDDCRECVFCRDMRKYGGPGTMKQTCIKRRCLNPILPSSACDKERTTEIAEKVEPDPPVFLEKETERPDYEEEFVPMKAPKLDIEDLRMEDAFDDSMDSQYSRSNIPVTAPLVLRISSHELLKYPIRPAPKGPIETTNGEIVGFSEGMIKVWTLVFDYLSQKDLCSCMLVCKNFLRISGSPQYWKRIDLTAQQIKPATLQCLVRRAPESLNLSHTNISHKQLLWLLERSPCLHHIYLEGCSWCAVAALNAAACFSFRTVDISWTAGFTDPQLKHLLSTPKDARPGQVISHTRLHFCEEISLAGTDITDKGLRLLSQQLPYLKYIDVSFCSISNDGFCHLTSSAAKCKNLCSIISQHCPYLTDNVFVLIGKMQQIKALDFRNCPKITPAACRDFVVKFSDQLTLAAPMCIFAVPRQ